MALLMELKSTKGEVDRLEAKLKSTQVRVVELWQENSEQLLRYDGILAQKEQQLQQVKKDIGIKRAEASQTESIFSDRSSHSRFLQGFQSYQIVTTNRWSCW